MKTIALICAGPSVDDVDLEALDMETAAISTAIRCFRMTQPPDYWVLIDEPSKKEFGENGETAMGHPLIQMILPDCRNASSRVIPNAKYFDYVSENPPPRDRKLFDLKLPFFAPLPHVNQPANLSLIFAMQVLYTLGYQRQILYGVDLKMTKVQPYSWSRTPCDDANFQTKQRNLECCEHALRHISERAPSVGLEVFAVNEPGSTILDIFPAWEHQHAAS